MGIICIFQNGDYVYLIDQPIKLIQREHHFGNC